MATDNVIQLTLELLHIPYHVYEAEVAVAYVQTEYKTYVFCFSDRDKFIKNVHKNGVGEGRLRNALIGKHANDYIARNVESSSEKLFFKYIVNRFENTDSNSAIRLTGDKLSSFWDKHESGAIKDQLSKKITDDILEGISNNKMPQPNTTEDVLEAHGLFDEVDWTYREFDDFATCTHSNGCMIILEEKTRHDVTVSLDLTEEVHRDLKELSDVSLKCPKLFNIINELTDIPRDEIVVVANYTVSKNIVPTGDTVELKFDALPYLVTNTLVNYKFDKVELRHVSNENRLRVADLNNQNCLGVLLDFTDPVMSLKMLEISRRNNCNIYIIQESENGPEIVTYLKANTRTSRRNRR